MSNGMKILAVSAATAGHIFPALGFLDTLKDRDKDIDTLLVLPRHNIIGRKEKFGQRVKYISILPVKLNLAPKNLITVFNFLKGALESMLILLVFRPDLVVGFGSLASIPMLIFAWLFRIRTLIHEQNVIPGRANRFLAGFSDRVAVSFSETQAYFKKYKSKVMLTGNPLRKGLSAIDKNKALDFFGFKNNKFTILIIGGSQGSHSVNLGFLQAVSQMQDRPKLQIIHLAGPVDRDLLEDNYKKFKIEARLFDFFQPMHYAYSASDLVVSRAGAGTITELIFFRIPAILIPYPFAYKHQMANAEALNKRGCAIIIEDSRLGSGALKDNIEDFINNSHKTEAMRLAYAKFGQIDANTALVESALSLN